MRRFTSRCQSHFYPRSPCGERLGAPVDKMPSSSISIHALLAESDCEVRIFVDCKGDFYPRSPCGERPKHTEPLSTCMRFLSTLSLRRATDSEINIGYGDLISIHALLAESDLKTPPQGSRSQIFLSTLSLRRATPFSRSDPMTRRYFYPRSPCGERLARDIILPHILLFLSTLSLRRATMNIDGVSYNVWISIHALLAESDHHKMRYCLLRWISIHALLAESDAALAELMQTRGGFLSTLSLRRATLYTDSVPPASRFLSTLSLRRATARDIILPHILLFLSTLSLRRATSGRLNLSGIQIFLSTLSLRRATIFPPLDTSSVRISIHALLAESDTWQLGSRITYVEFLSTLSLRRATAKVHKTVGHFCAYETNFMGIASSC